jgi:NifU-like protein involved in Fe-S cluster formation
MSNPTNHVAALVRSLAQKVAAEGQPDRMTQNDGHGGITVGSESPSKHPDEDKLKKDMPANGMNAPSKTNGLGQGPDRMTQNDGHGGIAVGNDAASKDMAEEDLKQDMPADGKNMGVKCAADRISSIRSAVFGRSVPTASAAAATKSATGATLPDLDLSTETLAKIASSMLATEEGSTSVFRELYRQEGEKAATERIHEVFAAADIFQKAAAETDQIEIVKQAAADEIFEKAAAIFHDLQAQGVTDEDASWIMKTASDHQNNFDSIQEDWVKAAYAQGMDDAAMLEDAAEGEGMEMDEEEVAPEMEDALPMGGDQLGEEEIIALLEQAIEAGIITPEDVAAALAEDGGEGAEMEMAQ